MRSNIAITALLLLPTFLLVAEDVSWEKMSLRYIRRIGDRTGAHDKLRELGFDGDRTYENFRYRQLILIFLVLSCELFGAIFLNLAIAPLFVLFAISIGVILFLTEKNLTNEVKEHRESIDSDYPAIVEIFTLSLSAGESPLTSMQHIATRGSGPLSREFAQVISSVMSGIPFATALDSMGRRMTSVAVRRFVDSIVIAITRGAPLIDVLHSQAQESRDFQRNRILSAASKAELSMMIPVVFLILPISILFALWPSLSNLNLFAQG
jgi:tight adherence protein C